MNLEFIEIVLLVAAAFFAMLAVEQNRLIRSVMSLFGYTSDFLTLWRSISSLLFGSLFPLFIAFGLVLLTLVLGISALLRRGE
jgi:multidrug transporter EmrE-like cation transporter